MNNKHPLQMVFENCEYKCDDYSGRGMMGKRCLAIYPKGSNLGEIFSDILLETFKSFDRHDLGTTSIASAFRDMRTDAMGKGMVVYFPTVEYFDDNEDDEEEGDDEL